MSDFVLNIVEDVDKTTDTDGAPSPWLIGIIDDEESVHQATTIALSRSTIQGRELKFLHAYNAKEGYSMAANHPDLAVVLLDVVMESKDAGLALVDKLRTDLKRLSLQIILRTGQPGQAPESEVVEEYEINAYKTKNELTKQKLFSTISAAIRAYRHLGELNDSRRSIRAVAETSAKLHARKEVDEFARGVLGELEHILGTETEGLICISRYAEPGQVPPERAEKKEYRIAAATGKYQALRGGMLGRLADRRMDRRIVKAINEKRHVTRGEFGILYFRSASEWEGVIVFDNTGSLHRIDGDLLQIFCLNVSLGFENAKFIKHLDRIAMIDHLTGLLTRQGLIDRILRCEDRPVEPYCVYLVDIDYFHEIVIGMGYAYGGQVLCRFGEKLTEICGERGFVARLHADVFAVVVMAGSISGDELAERCARPLSILDNRIRVGVTVGCASASRHEERREAFGKILQQAETALNVAKNRRRGSSAVYDTSMDRWEPARLGMVSDIRDALDEHQFFLVMQPKVRIHERSIVGYEALIRWKHPETGLVNPSDFIPVVNRSGLYIDVDLYVLREVCLLLRRYPELNVPVSLNVSAHSIHHSGFVDDVATLCEALQPDISMLELEVTEYALIRGKFAIESLKRLRQLGFKLCLDDFGSGYSSLSYLMNMPLDVIKIDRSFVRNLSRDEDAQIVLEGTVSIGKRLDKEIVIEGVETQTELDAVAAMGVSVVQGFFFYRPLEIPEALALI